MTKKDKKTWLWVAIAGLIIYLLTRKKTRLSSNRYEVVNSVDGNGNVVPKVVLVNGGSSTGTVSTNTMTPAVLAVQYFSLMENSVRSYISDPAFGIYDLPWQLDLAKYTTNYNAVKAEYLKYYGRNLTNDLLAWLDGPELSDYVAALYKNNQVMTP